MKKFFQFACIAVIAASFVACGSCGTTSDSADSTSVSKTVVVDTTACNNNDALGSNATIEELQAAIEKVTKKATDAATAGDIKTANKAVTEATALATILTAKINEATAVN